MQHDTSPHELELAGKKRQVQTASAVLCFSRMLFFQCYPTFQRFDCKVFLTDALRYFCGATERVMIDNTHVVVLRGSGRDMVPVPEMAAFAERFGFQFVAHAIGNANRSARVERPFWFIERNFLAGRRFATGEDLNGQARQWCDKVNSTYKKHIRAVPRELFAVERLQLKPLPSWIPEVYRLQQRMVDIEGYIAIHTNRYSVPLEWIGRRVEVRESRDKIEIQLDARRLVTHRRMAEAEHLRVLLPEHRPPRGQRVPRPDPHPEEQAIVTAAPELADYVGELKQRSRKVVTLALRQLLRLVRGVSTGTVARRRARGCSLWSVRSGPSGAHDLTARGARILFARYGSAGGLTAKQSPAGKRKPCLRKQASTGSTETMTEELEQLLKNLKLRRILEIFDEQLRAADKDEVKFQQRYVMSHRNVVNCLWDKAFGQFCSSHGDHPVSRLVLGA